MPRIAVYVTGNGVSDNEKNALGTRLLTSLINSKRYMGIERSNSFLAEIDKEQLKQRSGAIDDGQISELGKQFGVKFVCVANITPVRSDFQVSARIINVETAQINFIGESVSSLETANDLMQAADEVVKNMFSKQVATLRDSKPTATPPAKQQREKAPPPPSPAATKVGQIVITSSPSGATIEIGGKRVGTTPHTYKPSSRGDIVIAVSMNGYEKASRIVEFGDGAQNVSFTLSRVVAAPPPSSPPVPTPAQKPAPEPKPDPKTNPPPKPERVSKPMEEADDLALLLEDLPQPRAQLSAVGVKQDAYLTGVVNKIERHWTPSVENSKISVAISFTIEHDGTAANIRVTTSSGDKQVDRDGLNAVMRASPFGKLPPHYSRESVDLNITLYPSRKR